MTPPLTIKDLNCSTCTKCPYLFGSYFEDRLSNPVYETTKSIGCASHPLALQVLAAPVIEKLEIKRDAKKGLYLKEQAQGIDEAIKFLKGDH